MGGNRPYAPSIGVIDCVRSSQPCAPSIGVIDGMRSNRSCAPSPRSASPGPPSPGIINNIELAVYGVVFAVCGRSCLLCV